MSVLERERRSRRARRNRRVVRLAGAVLLAAVAFLLGAAFARTLDERPEPGAPTTIVRILEPLPQQPPVRTVTVTVTGP